MNDSALFSIYNQFGVKLHDIICKKVKHEDHCHDVMQEVYLKIMLNLEKIEHADNLPAYLVRLTNNTVIDHYRKAKHSVDDVALDNVGSDDGLFKDQSLQLANCCLRPMIDSLPEVYRDALVMTELGGMKLKDYAEQARISLSNAKIRVQRAKEKLKEIILDCCSYDFDKYGNIVDCRQKDQSGCCKK